MECKKLTVLRCLLIQQLLMYWGKINNHKYNCKTNGCIF